MIKRKFTPLEKKSTNYSQVTDVTRRKERQLQKAKDAYSHLLSIKDYPTPDTLAQLTIDSLNAFIDEKVNAVRTTAFLTDVAKGQNIKEWEMIRQQVCRDLRDITSFVEHNPDAVVMIDEDGLKCETDLRYIAQEQCTQIVPKEAHEHWRLLNLVFDAVADLRKWERENDCKKFRLEDLARMTAQTFAENWTFGQMQRDHRYDDTFGAISQRVEQEFYL